VGGMLSSAVLTLLVIPVIYALINQKTLSSAKYITRPNL